MIEQSEERLLADAHPIRQYVIKVASRCNLACPYCYEYFHGDQSWKSMPKRMEVALFDQVLERITAHAQEHGLKRVSISLHGGEPLLVGFERFKEYLERIAVRRGEVEIEAGIQTNATLYDAQFHELCLQHGVTVGVSLDGPAAVNDLRRPRHDGGGSTAAVERALGLLSGSPNFGGLLAVIPVEAEPSEIFDYLAQWRPPIVDFLLPHAHWENPAPGHPASIARGPQGWCESPPPPYGLWLARCFDDWWDHDERSDIAVRTFEEIIKRLAGREGVLETLGTEPVSLITVAADGAYEGVDTLKSAFPGAQHLGLSVLDATVTEVANHDAVQARQLGVASLSDECQQCSLVQICGGGYLPHRFGNANFKNPSVYCGDLAYLIQHIRARMLGSGPVEDA